MSWTAYDTNGDGWADVHGLDTDYDGDAEMVQLDRNQDGYVDGVMLDNNNDGFMEVVAVDNNQNGYFEAVVADMDGDGYLETAVVDNNENGQDDATEYTPTIVFDGVVGGTSSGYSTDAVLFNDYVGGPATYDAWGNLIGLAAASGQATFGTAAADSDGVPDEFDPAPRDGSVWR
jgi:hypothetical protein